MLARLLDFVTWPMLRTHLPVFLCLAGTGMSVRGKLFIGWFGPRGLASIVFAVIVFDAGVPGGNACRDGRLDGAAQRPGMEPARTR